MAFACETNCDIKLVEPFIRATKAVFETMLQSECRPGDIEPVNTEHRRFDVISLISLSGGIEGELCISLSAQAAMQALERMTGLEATELDEFVRDTVGEISNMVGGKGKRELARFALNLGLPQVSVGGNDPFEAGRWLTHSWIAFETDIGPCALEVGFNA